MKAVVGVTIRAHTHQAIGADGSSRIEHWIASLAPVGVPVFGRGHNMQTAGVASLLVGVLTVDNLLVQN